jgi:hypothetical protein
MRSFLVLIMMLAGRAEAQRLDTIYVGSAHLSTGYMHNDSYQEEVVVPDSSAPQGQRVIGHSTTEARVVQDHGKPVLFRVAHFKSARSEVTDSIMTAGTGLVPMWETSHQTSKLMHLTWDGRHVTGDVTPTGKPKEAIDQTMAVPPFNSSDIQLVVASLSLTPGYRALLANYEYESGGLRLDTLAVTGRDQNGWVVRLSRGDSASFTMWLDPTSKRVNKMEIASGPHTWQARVIRQQ